MTENAIYPLTFNPIFKDYPWGGRKLGDKLGRAIPAGIVAESWEIAAHPNGSSTVNNGPLAGLTLPQVQEKLGLALLGSRNKQSLVAGKFPLLIKFLDANDWLSVQVHPDDTYAQAHGGDSGKTEMWVFLDAEKDSNNKPPEIIFGFKRGVTRASFAQAVADGKTTELLHRVPVKAGDVVFVPAGAVHALGTGTLIAEIQQNSDVTYRIDDWGRPRPLHIAQALDVLDFALVEPKLLQPITLLEDEGLRVEQIGHCAYFETERLTMPADNRFFGLCDGETFELWAVLAGAVTLEWDGEPLLIKAVTWVLLPADLGEFQVTADLD
ncbi:MAG: class I mannose-6-phosphate isomerase, partial [Chloroflexota bacterium]|nr:class I mannose-6-phosphate isomerase [Chloroflexota bacterium]